MSLTSGHQIAFRALAGSFRHEADRNTTPFLHEFASLVASALDGAADALAARDAALSEPFDHKAANVTYDPKRKAK